MREIAGPGNRRSHAQRVVRRAQSVGGHIDAAVVDAAAEVPEGHLRHIAVVQVAGAGHVDGGFIVAPRFGPKLVAKQDQVIEVRLEAGPEIFFALRPDDFIDGSAAQVRKRGFHLDLEGGIAGAGGSVGDPFGDRGSADSVIDDEHPASAVFLYPVRPSEGDVVHAAVAIGRRTGPRQPGIVGAAPISGDAVPCLHHVGRRVGPARAAASGVALPGDDDHLFAVGVVQLDAPSRQDMPARGAGCQDDIRERFFHRLDDQARRHDSLAGGGGVGHHRIGDQQAELREVWHARHQVDHARASAARELSGVQVQPQGPVDAQQVDGEVIAQDFGRQYLAFWHGRYS